MEEGGGPFGAVVVRGGEIIGRGVNRVTVTFDPTAHAEVTAIRDACRNIGDFSLQGCELYTSCQPCPMCLCAALWARLDRIYYANTTRQAARAGFDDEIFYREVCRTDNGQDTQLVHLDDPLALTAFEKWRELENRTEY